MVSVEGVPFEINGQLYVPARFLVNSLGGTTVSWDATKRIYTATGLLNYASASAQFAGSTYTVDKKQGVYI